MSKWNMLVSLQKTLRVQWKIHSSDSDQGQKDVVNSVLIWKQPLSTILLIINAVNVKPKQLRPYHQTMRIEETVKMTNVICLLLPVLTSLFGFVGKSLLSSFPMLIANYGSLIELELRVSASRVISQFHPIWIIYFVKLLGCNRRIVEAATIRRPSEFSIELRTFPSFLKWN